MGGYEMVSGWKARSEALKATQKSDSWCHRIFKLKGGMPATVKELLDWLGK